MYDVKRLDVERVKRGWNYVRLAEKAHMPEPTVRQLLQRGSGHPDNLRKIAKALGLELEDIVLEEQSA